MIIGASVLFREGLSRILGPAGFRVLASKSVLSFLTAGSAAKAEFRWSGSTAIRTALVVAQIAAWVRFATPIFRKDGLNMDLNGSLRDLNIPRNELV
jgi:hypothetical protein